MNKPLTQRTIDTTPTPETGFKELRDHGLVVRLYATGKKAFSFEYVSPLARKNARISFEATSLADARATVHRYRVMLTEGRDPNQERKESVHAEALKHARSLSVGDALAAYERSFVTGDKAASRRERMKLLRRGVEPFVDRAVASLTKGELVNHFDDVQNERGPIARNRTQAEVRAWLGWLCEREHVPSIIIAGVKKRGQETKRTRVLADAELGAIVAAADGSAFCDIVLVLLHTAMRKSEAANLQPRDLDFEARTIKVRSLIAKNSEERTIPMADAIAPMLRARCEGLDRDAFIFGEGSGFAGPFSGWGKPTDRLRAAMPEGDQWQLHDLRRTVATRLREAGVENLVVEDLLGHISGERGGVAGVYNQAETLPKQAVALKAWAATLATLGAPKVVALKRRVA